MKCCQIIKIADKYELKVGDVKKLIPNLVTKLIMYFITKSSVVPVLRNETD